MGIATGAWTFWWCGEHAIRKLEREGPELLATLRHGATATTADSAETDSERMPVLAQAALAVCWTVGMIAMFPQALVPAVFKLTDQDESAWFLPLHLSDPWQWPAIFGMLALGGVCVVLALKITNRYSDLEGAQAA